MPDLPATVLGADLTLALLPATAGVHLRAADIPALESAGKVGRLLARQARAYAQDTDRAALAAAHEGLPDDLLNFHWDPVTAALAVGWSGAGVEEIGLRPRLAAGVLAFARARSGPQHRILTSVDPAAFTEAWLEAVTRLP